MKDAATDPGRGVAALQEVLDAAAARNDYLTARAASYYPTSSTLLGRVWLAGSAVLYRHDPSGDRGGPAPAAGFCRGYAGGLPRKDQRAAGELYVRGLLTDGQRKSMQPMAARLGVDHQRLQQFITSSTWDYVAVRRNVAR